MSINRSRANRINAKASTGPRTLAGKSVSSCNSLVHGLSSSDRRNVRQPFLAEWQRFFDAFGVDLKRVNEEDYRILDQLVVVRELKFECLRNIEVTALIDSNTERMACLSDAPVINEQVRYVRFDQYERKIRSALIPRLCVSALSAKPAG